VTIKGRALIDININVVESNTLDDLVATFPIVKQITTSLINGTTNGTSVDTVFYDRYTTDQSTTIDLLGSLTSRLTGSTISFVDVAAIMVFNESAAASGTKITCGNATNAWVGATAMLVAANDQIVVHPQGLFLWVNPDGSAPGAGATDEFKMVPGASTTWWLFILGRSA
jgi:hypothetical protein